MTWDWRLCDPSDSQAGATHFFTAGRTLPPVTVVRNLTTWQKVRGEPQLDKVPANWTLVSYDTPDA